MCDSPWIKTLLLSCKSNLFDQLLNSVGNFLGSCFWCMESYKWEKSFVESTETVENSTEHIPLMQNNTIRAREIIASYFISSSASNHIQPTAIAVSLVDSSFWKVWEWQRVNLNWDPWFLTSSLLASLRGEDHLIFSYNQCGYMHTIIWWLCMVRGI